MMSKYLFVFLLFTVAVLSSNVVDLTPANFDTVVDGSKHVFVEFFAPWCGHCKNLAPVYEEVADAFQREKDVVIAKVDADAEKSLGGRFGVKGFPTLKFFPKGSTEAEDYSGGRTADDLINYINGKAGTRAAVYKPPTDITVLTNANFDKVVLDPTKNVLVEFYAPWCGHCKNLAPTWEKLATVFKNDENVVVANIDADQYKDIGGRYGVSGFPTLKYFPADNKEGEAYSSGRDLKDLVAFLNEKTGAGRLENGRLNDKAGTFDDLSDLASQFVASENRDELIQSATDIVKALKGKDATNAEWYVKYMKAIVKRGNDFAATEVARLEGLLDGGAMSAAKLDEFTVRKNVVSKF